MSSSSSRLTRAELELEGNDTCLMVDYSAYDLCRGLVRMMRCFVEWKPMQSKIRNQRQALHMLLTCIPSKGIKGMKDVRLVVDVTFQR